MLTLPPIRMFSWLRRLALIGSAALVLSAHANEATIEQALRQAFPNLTTIDEIRSTPMPGLFEVRVGTDLFYTDATGQFVLQGTLLSLKERRNLTQERLDQLLAIDFAALPWSDAIKIQHGQGGPRIAVFEDPNCGYCKRFERDMQAANVTMYVFLYPVLGADSNRKSQAIWCAADRAEAWLDWMLNAVDPGQGTCNTDAIKRNLALGNKHGINGTPTIVFADGSRAPGAIPRAEVMQRATAAGR
ncbi:MAG: DsbC family protein [Burkholderiaceae bacterium]